MLRVGAGCQVPLVTRNFQQSGVCEGQLPRSGMWVRFSAHARVLPHVASPRPVRVSPPTSVPTRGKMAGLRSTTLRLTANKQGFTHLYTRIKDFFNFFATQLIESVHLVSTNLAGQCNSPAMRKGTAFLCFFNLALHSEQSRKSRKCERNVREIIKGLQIIQPLILLLTRKRW